MLMGVEMKAEHVLHLCDKKKKREEGGQQKDHGKRKIWKAGKAGGGRFRKQKRKLLASERFADGGNELEAWNEEQTSNEVSFIYFG